MTFDGAKAALFIGARLLVYRRDDRPDLPWPGMWDLPGGGREGDETPEQTLRREVHEEFGLDLPAASIRWRRAFAAAHRPGARVWFFVAALPEQATARVVFGDEGQEWRLMTPEAFLALPDAVPSFAPRLRIWADETGGWCP
ncbi:MAG: 8-oxo-dGTP diphosphatase [Rhodobacteraceae bacterium HLUCCA08]|nr:MAG: 8-oxo-dGTP diphosphatase [Rhodobacteraceae bacterium HLUCCA08]